MVARKVAVFWPPPGQGKGFTLVGTGSVRVIGGIAKGRRLRIPPGRKVRPTSDRVKESIFNILIGRLNGITVLDLFAGSGNLGIEALSRGARQAVFVDRDRQCTRIITENLSHLGLLSKGEVLLSDCLTAVAQLEERPQRFSLIFSDPPYEGGWIQRSLVALAEGDLLEDGGWIVAEHSRRESVPDKYGGFRLEDQRIYGETMISFYMHEELIFS